MSKRYFVNTAKLGAESKPIDFYYQWGSICENCGKHPIAWVVVFADKDGNLFGTGTECAKNLQSWGSAYSNFSHFKKKVELYALLTDTKLSEMKKQKVKVTLAQVDELIKNARELKDRQIESEKKARWDAQADVRAELLPARKLNRFTEDVLKYADEGGVLSERQIEAVRNCMSEAKRKAGSVEGFISNKDIEAEKMKLTGDVINILLTSRLSIWSRHVELLASFRDQLMQTGRLSDKQITIIASLISRHRKQIAFARERGKRKDDVVPFDAVVDMLLGKISDDAGQVPTEKDVTSFRETNHAVISEQCGALIDGFLCKYGRAGKDDERVEG